MISTIGWADEVVAEKMVTFIIPQQRADTALTEFAEQADLTLVFPPELVGDKLANELIGKYTQQEGADILLAGTGLNPTFSNRVVLSIAADEPSANEGEDMDIKNKAGFLAALVTAFTGVNAQDLPDGDDSEPPQEIEEIVVVGSHIRGASSASPVATYSRDDIEQTGVATLPDFLRTLPQVFGGGASEITVGQTNTNNAGRNLTGGSGVNLRGLGVESTLVLLDGRRIAPASFGDFVDTSLFPLIAIERVEVLTDGASALYGADAVAGVVNFVLRKDFDGAETRIRYGSVTEGNSDEFQFGQVFGNAWDSGNILFSYEYYQREHLDSEDRTFTESGADPAYILPDQERHSAFLKGEFALSDTADLFASAFYSKREADRLSAFSSLPIGSSSTSESELSGGSVGAGVGLPGTWSAEIVGSYNKSSSSSLDEVFFLPRDPAAPLLVRADLPKESEVWSLDAVANGQLWEASGGPSKVAVGTQVRRESFQSLTAGGIKVDTSRNVYALFAEINVPLISGQNRKNGAELLELSLAGRYENYSDFGDSIDPKIGVLWSPISGLSARATVGTSFRAPILQDLSEHNVAGTLADAPDPSSPTGTTLAVFVSGNNADLEPETATTWTVGLDIEPKSLPNFDLSLTYFSIDYDDRIASADAFISTAFFRPELDFIISRDPDPAYIEYLFTLPTSTNRTTSEPLDAQAIVDDRLRNLTSVQVSGVDFAVNYSATIDGGTLNASLNGTYLLEKENQLFETTAPFDVIDTVYNPADLKIRGGLSWAKRRFSSGLFVNYVDGYRDDRPDPTVGISSWTTVDVQLHYRFDSLFDISISANNLFDEDPPFVQSTEGRFYDPNNASPLGRFVSIQIDKDW